MRIGVLLFVLLIEAHALFGSLETHFKKPEDKGGSHGMGNIDFVYMINLDQRPEKYESCIQQLSQYGIFPYRFSAVNGWELSLADITDIGIRYEAWMKNNIWGTYYIDEEGGHKHEVMHQVGRTYFCHCMARGAMGCALSHLSVLQDAYDSGYQTIWVMEDDIQIIKNPHLVTQLIDLLDERIGKSNWDILYTDQDTKNRNGQYVPCQHYALRPNFTPVNPQKAAIKKRLNRVREVREIGARYGTYSMVIRRSGMKKMLDFFKQYKIFLPIDMDLCQIDDIHLFTVVDDIVSTQLVAPSDNGGAYYKNRTSN